MRFFFTSSGGARQRRRKSTTDDGQPEIVGSAAKKWSHPASSGSNFFLQGFPFQIAAWSRGKEGGGGAQTEERQSGEYIPVSKKSLAKTVVVLIVAVALQESY